ncbi:alanine racemase [Clostridium felsineum]|uniref:alanine racemase n=1 Tax=Clostridium felsineum TaxID=36839 RepID=UPI00098C78E0|nr:alanine racemase [Clostridium felsineum]URZ01561.1 Alanine racemase 1 [Clostridium felsineum]
MQKYIRTYVKINLKAIENNINEVKKKIKNSSKIMAVIKADGYGHGALKIGNFLKDKVDYFAVATLEEGIELRESGINTAILVLGYTSPKQFSDLEKYNITQTIYNLEMVENCKEKIKVHLAVETGMNRIGFKVNEKSISDINKIESMKNIDIEGVFTHFSCADEKDKNYTKLQKKKYDKFIDMLEKEKIKIPLKHVCNSAGIVDFDDHYLNMVRSGIITYGLYPSEEVHKEAVNLKPALEWKAHVINISSVNKGEGVSYGKTYITKGEVKLATVSIGYADGYMRALSSKGKVLIHGKYANIVGRICMDQMMVDVTDIENVNIEDTVTLIGKDGENTITVEELAYMAGSFNYEFVCNIGKRVERIYE